MLNSPLRFVFVLARVGWLCAALGCAPETQSLESKSETLELVVPADWASLVANSPGDLCADGQAALAFDSPGRAYAFEVALPKGAVIRLWVDGPVGFDSVLAVWGPDGATGGPPATPAVVDDDSGPGLLSDIRDFTVRDAGRHVIVLGTFGGNSRGEVVLRSALGSICREPLECDDADPCTLDTRTAQATCEFVAIECDDGNPCTFDACTNGSCLSTPISCDDENNCTTDTCAAGKCRWSPIDCDDSDQCTVDACEDPVGCTYAPRDCDDGTLCTVDTCLPASGCAHEAVVCSDSSACTTDVCDAQFGCLHLPVACVDGTDCTDDTCEDAIGCVFVAVDCADGDECTQDQCLPVGGCTNLATPCDDGEICTTDSCDPAVGCVFEAVECSDGSACTDDSCGADGECAFVAIDCADDELCTVDDCDPETGCTHAPVECEDEWSCTNDACNPTTGTCAFLPDNAHCVSSPPDLPADLCVPTHPDADERGCISYRPCEAPGAIEMCVLTELVDWPGPLPDPGLWFTCDFRITASSEECLQAGCRPEHGNFRFGFDPDVFTLWNAYSENCLGLAPCTKVYLPVTALYDGGGPFTGPNLYTGHEVAISPSSGAEWESVGWGTVNVSPTSQPTPMSTAYLETGELGGNIVGNPIVLRFFLKAKEGYFLADADKRLCVDAVSIFGPAVNITSFKWDAANQTLVTF